MFKLTLVALTVLLLQITACGKITSTGGQVTITPWTSAQEQSFTADCTSYNDANPSQSPVATSNVPAFCECLTAFTEEGNNALAFSAHFQELMGQIGYNQQCVNKVEGN